MCCLFCSFCVVHCAFFLPSSLFFFSFSLLIFLSFSLFFLFFIYFFSSFSFSCLFLFCLLLLFLLLLLLLPLSPLSCCSLTSHHITSHHITSFLSSSSSSSSSYDDDGYYDAEVPLSKVEGNVQEREVRNLKEAQATHRQTDREREREKERKRERERERKVLVAELDGTEQSFIICRQAVVDAPARGREGQFLPPLCASRHPGDPSTRSMNLFGMTAWRRRLHWTLTHRISGLQGHGGGGSVVGFFAALGGSYTSGMRRAEEDFDEAASLQQFSSGAGRRPKCCGIGGRVERTNEATWFCFLPVQKKNCSK